ncbi:MAG: hypothetical protein QGH40_10600 [bacterium]|nr:hypothetical protein [bacterium]
MKTNNVTALVLLSVMVFTLTGIPAAAGGLGDTIDKYKDMGDEYKDIYDSGKDIWDQIDDLSSKLGEASDPKMNPAYLAMKQREIRQALEDYQDAEKRYEETSRFRLFARSSRKKAMDQAREEYLEKVKEFSRTKVNFTYEAYKSADGFMGWRKSARKDTYRDTLKEHCDFLLNRADEKVKRTRREYRDEWWIFFWSKLKKRGTYERAKADYQDARDEVDYLWSREDLITEDGWFRTRDSIFQTDVGPAEEGDKIERENSHDM